MAVNDKDPTEAILLVEQTVNTFNQIVVGQEGQFIPVPGYPDQPTLAERVKQNLKPSTDAAAGFAATSRDEANRAAQEAAKAKQISGLETVDEAVRLATLPVPDVSIPFTTDGQLLHGKGTPVLVGTTPVAQLVSYERLGSQTMLDKSGRLVTVPAGEMAIEQQGLAIFGQSVNLAAPSINWVGTYAASNWSHDAKDEGGWIKLTGSSSPSSSLASCRDFIVPTEALHTFSLDILKAPTLNCKLSVYDGAVPFFNITFTQLSVSGSGSENVTDQGAYWRVEIPREFSSATKLFRLFPFGAVIGASGEFTYRRVQLEAKPFATPYIENTTSAQTVRPATTRCDIPWLGNMPPISDNQQLTIALEFDTVGFPVSGGAHAIFTEGAGLGQYMRLHVEASGLLRSYRGAAVSNQQAISPRRKYKVCLRIDRNVIALFVDGIKGAETTAAPLSSGLPGFLRLGYSHTPNYVLNGHLRSITIWNAPLTDIQCQAASS